VPVPKRHLYTEVRRTRCRKLQLFTWSCDLYPRRCCFWCCFWCCFSTIVCSVDNVYT